MKKTLFVAGLVFIPGMLTGYLIYKLYRSLK